MLGAENHRSCKKATLQWKDKVYSSWINETVNPNQLANKTYIKLNEFNRLPEMPSYVHHSSHDAETILKCPSSWSRTVQTVKLTNISEQFFLVPNRTSRRKLDSWMKSVLIKLQRIGFEHFMF